MRDNINLLKYTKNLNTYHCLKIRHDLYKYNNQTLNLSHDRKCFSKKKVVELFCRVSYNEKLLVLL